MSCDHQFGDGDLLCGVCGATKQDEPTETKEGFLCAIERKQREGEVCSFCKGGCKPEGDLPGLADIEREAIKSYGGTILESGYSQRYDMFVVDVKAADGRVIEVFYSGSGEPAGWQRLNDALIEQKSLLDPVSVVSIDEAEAKALEKFPGSSVIGVEADAFESEDAWVVAIDTTDGKSFDVYVGLDGKILGYDEIAFESMDDDDPEIKELEAELELKRAYNSTRRSELAEEGMALPDGSYPIVDKADLANAIQAFGRAKDPEATKAHIMKRAMALGAEDMIPESWLQDEAKVDAPVESKGDVDAPVMEEDEEENEDDDEEDEEEEELYEKSEVEPEVKEDSDEIILATIDFDTALSELEELAASLEG